VDLRLLRSPWSDLVDRRQPHLEPGMTLAVESFIGHREGGEGVKLEEQILITEHGVERLSVYGLDDRLIA
jgi:Xaa-Pro aminopeptidase